MQYQHPKQHRTFSWRRYISPDFCWSYSSTSRGFLQKSSATAPHVSFLKKLFWYFIFSMNWGWSTEIVQKTSAIFWLGSQKWQIIHTSCQKTVKKNQTSISCASGQKVNFIPSTINYKPMLPSQKLCSSQLSKTCQMSNCLISLRKSYLYF